MKFTIYSKEDCPYCEKIKDVMKMANFEHVVYTLNQNFTKEQFYSEFGNGSTFPQVIMNETKIGGCIDTIKYLKDQGIL